jgi:hypothetical protein
MLDADQLLVERFDVFKITKMEYPIPQNIVTVQMIMGQRRRAPGR